MREVLALLRRFAGIRSDRAGYLEMSLSMVGGLVGLIGVMLISKAQLGAVGSVSLVASMGASAMLLFAVPHGPLSQPWPVFGGHLVSAMIGVACIQAIPDTDLAAPVAVGLAIGAMHYLRCMHPPGGATALSAVVGDSAVHQLGYLYVLTPVMLNAVTILLVALVFNYPFPWRRYPVALGQRVKAPEIKP
jgi:CBS-domain-containing membrane protein